MSKQGNYFRRIADRVCGLVGIPKTGGLVLIVRTSAKEERGRERKSSKR
jgi:hypothetical protein